MTTDTIERELTDLVVIPASDALKIFAAERKPGETHPIEPILAKVSEEAASDEQWGPQEEDEPSIAEPSHG